MLCETENTLVRGYEHMILIILFVNYNPLTRLMLLRDWV